MRSGRIGKLFIIFLLLYLPLTGFAWGLLGHRIVGEIADSYLNRKARKEVYRILGSESIAMSSNWADFIKSDPAYSQYYNWHFINIPGGLDREQFMSRLGNDTAVNAYTKIKWLGNALRDKSQPDSARLVYLRLLIHIVGDIHQPLHVGRLEDLGGNRVKVMWFNDAANLHQVWDGKLINFQHLSYTEYAKAINVPAKQQVKAWLSEPLEEWLYQSYLHAERIYGDIKQPEQKLDYKYNYAYLSLLNSQLLQGGIHLAAILNEIFG